jgi:hypothetical protein
MEHSIALFAYTCALTASILFCLYQRRAFPASSAHLAAPFGRDPFADDSKCNFAEDRLCPISTEVGQGHVA